MRSEVRSEYITKLECFEVYMHVSEYNKHLLNLYVCLNQFRLAKIWSGRFR